MSLPLRTPSGLLERLSPRAASVLTPVTDAAQRSSVVTYLVGGIVRDLLLGRESLDVDIVVEGDAIAFAQRVAEAGKGKVTAHAQFGTATAIIDGVAVDFATARTEQYPRPGALPVVHPSTIRDDLQRRDFTINAMAVSLNATNRGELLDPLGGFSDLQAQLVRVIHDKSFADDATRMLRAVRYEQRFSFRLEPHTKGLILSHAGLFTTISGERVRYEIERIFGEEHPEDTLSRAHALGMLRAIHPSLTWDDAARAGFRNAHDRGSNTAPVLAAVWMASIPDAPVAQIAERLAFPLAWTRAATETRHLIGSLSSLGAPDLANSRLYGLLIAHSLEAVNACRAIVRSPIIQNRLDLYMTSLRDVRPALTGRDLLDMGMSSGPAMGEGLGALKAARLDGEVVSRAEEVEFIRRWMEANRP